MRRLIVLVLVLLLAACGGSESALDEAESGSGPQPTEALVESEEGDTPAAEGVDASGLSQVGVVKERDWFKGSDDPAVTIIEYGDFQ